MDYVKGVLEDHRDWIENGTTVPLFQLACEAALRHGFVTKSEFKKGLYGYIPNYVTSCEDTLEARDQWVAERFEACFGNVDRQVVEEAKRTIRKHPGYCGGRFNMFALAARRTSARMLRECLEALLSDEPLTAAKRLLSQHRGKIRGFGLAGFSQLCYLCRDDLFPVMNMAVTPLPKVRALGRKFRVAQSSYQGYPHLAERLQGFLDTLRFPGKYRFSYFDRYLTHSAKERTVRPAARKAFLKEFASFVDALPDNQPRTRIARGPVASDFQSEGGKLLTTHRTKERKNRRAYLRSVPDPYRCKVCEIDLGEEYDVQDDYGVIEVHHKLLLATKHKPSPDELVGLCPNCHAMLHRYIAAYLREKQRKDFANRKEAFKVHDAFERHCHKSWA